MSDKQYVLPPPDSIIIGAKAAEKLIRAKNPEAALLYIYILKSGGELSLNEAADKLGLGDRIYPAISTLSDLGLVADDPKPIIERVDSPPNYSVEDIENSIAAGSSFGPMIKELQHALGKVLSSSDIIVFFGIYDYLGLPAEVIFFLVSYLSEQYDKRYGAGRRPTARAIEKEAYSWARNDVFTLEAAEKHIRSLAERKSALSEIKAVLGIDKRALSPTEEKYIRSWLDAGFAADAIELAYDRTVLKTGKLSWPYMNSIIKSWLSKGLRSTADIAASDTLPAIRTKSSTHDNPPKDAPEQSELERMKKYLNKLKQQ